MAGNKYHHKERLDDTRRDVGKQLACFGPLHQARANDKTHDQEHTKNDGDLVCTDITQLRREAGVD